MATLSDLEQPYGTAPVPPRLMRIAETIFERLPEEEAKEFLASFPDAIGVDGKDLSLVQWKFLLETLQALPEQPPEVQAAIDPVISGIARLASGGEWTAVAAAEAANAAADVPTEAAWVAWAAAWAAAVSPNWAAAAATWAARAAATEGEIRRQRDSLLRLIREAPVVC